MLVAAGDVSAVSTFSDEPWAQIIMCEPMLLGAGGVWVESHGGTRPVHPVLSAEDVTLIKRAFGCPLVQTEEETHAAPMDVLTTFGSRAAVA